MPELDLPPLPCSLEPLPTETLPGFLLRLSHRLELSPARISELTGLAAAGSSPARLPSVLLAEIPTANSRRFAAATRLTPDETVALTLASMNTRYPMSPTSHPRGSRLPPHERWIFAPATRYCPLCLAGDGSPIQQVLGGPWRRTWHLPVVFACPEHRVFLEHRCPGCRELVHAVRAGTPATLLPAMRAPALHPAQCRSVIDPGLGRTLPACCGTRLDRTPASHQADKALLNLQNKILRLLDSNGPAEVRSAGRQTVPIRYFTDLRALSLLISATWPTLRHLTPSDHLAAAVDQHVERQQRQIADRKAASEMARTGPDLDAPPSDAAASAALLFIADDLLTSPDLENVRERLRPLLPGSARQARRSFFGWMITRSKNYQCSDGLRTAATPLLTTFTKAGGSARGRREAVARPQRWDARHVPAYIPEDWHTRHFAPAGDVSPLFLRRTVALRLVQMVAGGSLGEAAGFLGIADTETTWQHKGRIYSGAGHVHSDAKSQPDPRAFDEALNTLAAELDHPATHLVDYQRRRQALQGWSITGAEWRDVVDRLPPVPGPVRPDLGDRKRHLASIYVWTRVTSGEHHFAPRPIEDSQPPGVQEIWAARRGTIWYLLNNHLGPHYTALRAELGTLANALAEQIDSTAQPILVTTSELR